MLQTLVKSVWFIINKLGFVRQLEANYFLLGPMNAAIYELLPNVDSNMALWSNWLGSFASLDNY